MHLAALLRLAGLFTRPCVRPASASQAREPDSPLGFSGETPSILLPLPCGNLDTDDLLAFGLCDLGLGCPELGYVSLLELRTVRGKLGLPIERDLHFEADKPIPAYADEARSRGHIVT
jgi:hypothetical protein